MITLGSISREVAATLFPFLSARYPGRRRAIKDFAHRDPDFVFWIYPDGQLFDARDAHRKHVPRGFDHILADEPEYGGFLRGRLASDGQNQLLVIYCLPAALASAGPKLTQLLIGLGQLPVPVLADALVISDNGDIFGSLHDLTVRAAS